MVISYMHVVTKITIMVMSYMHVVTRIMIMVMSYVRPTGAVHWSIPFLPWSVFP